MSSTETKWRRVETVTLADQVYRIIRDRILNRELAPGEYIREQEVSDATGVSRTPVREALNRLASQDFLKRVPHRGFQVPDDPWEQLLEVYPIVAALECLAGSLSFERLGAPALRQLRRLNQGMKDAAAAGNAKEIVRLNNAFHKMISDGSGNVRLSALLDQLRDQLVLLDTWHFSVPENVEGSVGEHDHIVDAIEAREFDQALEMLRRNYARGQETIEAEIRRVAMG